MPAGPGVGRSGGSSHADGSVVECSIHTASAMPHVRGCMVDHMRAHEIQCEEASEVDNDSYSELAVVMAMAILLREEVVAMAFVACREKE